MTLALAGVVVSRIRAIVAVAGADPRLLIRAAGVQGAVIAGLRWGISPAALLARVPAGARRAAPEHAAAAVERSSRLFGRASTCLSRAIAAHALLRHDRSVHTLLGVRHDDRGSLVAHAWVERDGHTLLGALPGSVYAPVARFEGGRWRPL